MATESHPAFGRGLEAWNVPLNQVAEIVGDFESVSPAFDADMVPYKEAETSCASRLVSLLHPRPVYPRLKAEEVHQPLVGESEPVFMQRTHLEISRTTMAL